MTTAATSLLGLALPVTGELSGTWGDTVNNSITSLLDSAIAGTTTLSTDADVTLTTTTLSANQAREAVILWTAAGTVTRTITAPAQSKTYVVINKSSTQSIKLVGVGPTTGVTLVAGEYALVAWNGTDFAKVAGYGGSLTVSALTNTSLTSGRVVYSTTGGLETDSANLTFNGTTLTSTFSGPLNGTVGATTPSTGAFTTLSASSTATLSGGTANGVAYLNGSKVVTTGSALTFDGTNLTVGGSATEKLSTNGSLRVSGAVSANATGGILAYQGSGTTMLGAWGANTSTVGQIQFYLSSSDGSVNGELMRLTSTGLGIGTSSPGAKLDVRTSLSATTGVQNIADFYPITSGSTDGTYGGRITLYTKNLNGNYWPAAIAAINDTGGSNLSSLGFYTATAGPTFTERMRLDSSGNLGIGTTSPGAKLVVAGGSAYITNTAGNAAGIELAGNGNGAASTSLFIGQGGDSLAYVYQRANTSMLFGVNNTEQMRLTSTGMQLTNALAVTYGGTGLTTAPTNGALDIGNGTGFTRTTLTAGTGVSITNAAGSITIAATGSGGTVTSVTGTAPVVSSGGATPAISMAAANTTTNGYLTSTDWNTFNGKGSGTVTSVTGTAPVVSSGGTTPAISMAAASTSASGYLTSTDWNTFNGKQAAGSYVTSGGALGTPSSGTVTNLTGTASININGTVGATTPTTGAFTTLTASTNISSSRFNPRVSTTTSTATLTPDISANDQYNLTAQAATLTIAAPTGTPVDGNKLIIRILDNGTSQTLTWNATYTSIGVNLPTATTVSKMLYVGCIYNSTNARWDVLAVNTQA